MKYEVWIDAYNNKHIVSEMSDDYIKNCLGQIEKMSFGLKNTTPSNLTDSEMKSVDEVGTKAWYVVHGENYRKAFEKELTGRQENNC